MIAAHRDRHAMTGDDLVGGIDDWNFRDLAHSKDETLRWIDNGRKTVDAHAAKIRDGECAALKFLRLHPLVARAAGQVFYQLANFTERFVLRGANHRGQKSIFDCDGNAEIDIGVLHERVAVE